MKRAQLVAVVWFTVVVLAGCNWEEFRFGPSRTGFNTVESSITSANVSTLAVAWSAQTLGAVGDPVIGNGRVFVNVDPAASPNLSTVSAYDAATGTRAWSQYSAGTSTGLHDPAFSDGVVYAGWVQPEGTVNVGGDLQAMDAGTGKVQWANGDGTEGAPAVVGDVVYSAFFFETEGFQLRGWMAHDRATGSVLFGGPGPGPGSPTISNGILYQSASGTLAAYDATGSTCGPGVPFPKTCSALWTAGGDTTAAVTAGVVYVGLGNGVDAYNADTGALLWQAPTGGAVTSSPAVANGTVYVGSADGKLYALNATTGARRWTGSTAGAVNSSPAVANGVVFVGSNDGNVYGFDAAGCATGACPPRWRAVTGAPVTSSPAVSNGMVFVGSGNNLLAYRLPTSRDPGSRR